MNDKDEDEEPYEEEEEEEEEEESHEEHEIPPVLIASAHKRRHGVFKIPVPLHTFYAFIRSMCPIIKTIITPTMIANPNVMVAAAAPDGIVNDALGERTFFTLDSIAFKRGIFMGTIDPFMRMLANDFYHERCRFYAERSMATPAAYAQFVQVIRHICKCNRIEMISSLKYEQSQSNKENKMSEGGFTMLAHALFIGAVLYVVMKYGMHTSDQVAQDRSAFYGSVVLLYMVMFGHGAPTRINSNLF